MQVKEICEKIWDLEKKLSLINKQINGIYFWEVIRFDIYQEIIKDKYNLNNAHQYKRKINILSVIINLIVKNPFFVKGEYEYMVYDHTRKPKIGNENIDIYTKYILDELKQRALVIEHSLTGEHLTKKEKNRVYTEGTYVLAKIYKLFNKVRLQECEIVLLKKIQSEIKNIFEVDINLVDITKIKIENFIAVKEVTKILLNIIKPKYLIVVVGYCKKAVCEAAKECGIKVVELQHGVITKYHLGYSYPNNTKVNYFPDYLLTYGDYWQGDYIPLPKENIISYGFKHFNERKKILENLEKNNKQIIVISQGTIGEKLSAIILETAKVMSEYKFIYKLHPGEYYNWKEKYPKLKEASRLDNVEVIDHSNEDLYIYLKESEFVIGVYSTVIFEALGFDCKSIVVDLPGVEYLDELIYKGLVKVAKNSSDIENLIKTNEFKKLSNSELFFKKDIESITNLSTMIKCYKK